MSAAIREYRTLSPADYTVDTVHATAPGTAPGIGGHTVTLAHHTAGYEPAGSCARYAVETWRVTYTNARGQRHGQRFLADNEQGARDLFARWTKVPS